MAKFFMNYFSFFFFLYRVVFRQAKNPKALHRNVSNLHANEGQILYHKYPSFAQRWPNLSKDQTIVVFSVEEALLKSSYLFPYFMLVAFEAGGLFRAFLLFVLYPFLCLAGEEMGLKIMVFVCFFGIKTESFRVGSAVLPKFFLEDVALETLEMLKKGGKKVAFSNIPRVMVESFLRDYLGIDCVVGREMKVFGGYFLGVMEEKKRSNDALETMIGSQENLASYRDVIGISSLKESLQHHLSSHCNEIYLVRRADKRSWQHVARGEYMKPLIFHDGRLAFTPTPLATLTMFMWLPFGFTLSIIRAIIGLMLPHKLSIPILAYTGFHLSLSSDPSLENLTITRKTKGRLYVCNHRTLLDPLYLSFSLQKDIAAVTYSLSMLSELLAPIKTVRLTRDRDRDGEMIGKLLKQGDLVVCPEGTTCREPYLLRFSPLFAEMSDDIVPVAMDSHVGMFYGTTAGGLKCLDPLFFIMNPRPSYNVQILAGVSGVPSGAGNSETSRFEVANHVQSEIGKALGFGCTMLTRRDKYLILAGNEGTVDKH
ncbi:putative glycerol-3-phosphate acyltransferase 3 [Hibiscus syriacus]|uniref:Glycerol-3-phosphate acyltransferase 3 n=1 Tax=Hibiscus syriacus TaxID=106335 RepID=A0A6A3AU12_HIBSY|nr:probable glycerol-3-phosphate acyltransferase 3 [Hibiscus syriacus]KAE8708181.1 putative glycerol-3-phosphate acyltransferase 3 [Hibiscus syriacus]